MPFTDESGFTLVETLVAAVILFTCLAAAAVSYNTAVNLANKLNATTAISAAVPDIRDRVKIHLFNQETEGTQTFSEDLAFSWQAKQRSSARTIVGTGDGPDSGLESGRFEITLYEIDLLVTLSRNGRDHASRYAYTELVWQETGF